MAGQASYESVYRRTALVLIGLLATLVAGGVASWLVILHVHGPAVETAILAVAGATLVAIAAVTLAGLRTHCWTITPAGLEILERPKVPFTGVPVRRCIAFADIIRLERIESGVERQIAIVTASGQRHLLAAVMHPGPRGIGIADVASLEAFAGDLLAAMARAGSATPSLVEGPSFWNLPLGLGLLGVIFALSLLIAGGTAWALWLGAPVRASTSQAAAIFLLLPVGAFWLLRRAWRRRRALRRTTG